MAHLTEALHHLGAALRARTARVAPKLTTPFRPLIGDRAADASDLHLHRRRRLALVFVPMLLAILANSLLALRSFSDLVESERVVSHTTAVEAQIAAVETTLIDAERAERGYLLTGDPAFLAPYLAARASIDAKVAQLEFLTANDDAQQRRVAAIKPLITPTLAEMQRVIDLRASGHTDQAIDAVRASNIQGTMRSIRALLAEMDGAEERLLDDRLAAAGGSLAAAQTTMLVATLADVALLVALFALVQRAFAVRERHLRAEREARAAAEEAVVLRDQFLSVASHELRTPLTILLGNVQLIERRLARGAAAGGAVAAGSDERRRRDGFAAIDRQLDRLQALIAAMLDVSRINRGQLTIAREPLDLAALVRTVVDEVRPMAEAHPIELIIPPDACEPPGIMYVRGDALRLEQVVLHLLQNAIKYSPEGGPIRLELTRAAGRATISVADCGPGIQADAIPHLFERFYRAPSARSEHISGMGIGLYVVREIVALHGGAITAASTEGAGSVFTVHLPLLVPEGPVADAVTPTARVRRGGNDTSARATGVSSQPSPGGLSSSQQPRHGPGIAEEV